MASLHARKLCEDAAYAPHQSSREFGYHASSWLPGVITLELARHSVGDDSHVAHTGAEALKMAAQYRPQIGILDIGMPDLTGYDVAERIRREAWGQPMTLMAVTGWGQENDKRRAHAAGFDQHLPKPVDPQRVADMLNDVASD